MQASPLSKRASALLAQFPGPVTIRCSKWYFVPAFGMILVGAACFVWVLWPLWPRIMAHGWSASLVVLLLIMTTIIAGAAFILVVSMARDFPRITLDEDRFRFETLLFSFNRRWDDVSRFTSRVVYVGFSDASQLSGFWDRLNRLGSRGRRYFPGIFDLGTKNLARLLTAWRERALLRQ